MRVTLFLLAALAPAALGCRPAEPPPARFVRHVAWAESGVWLKADTHVHARISDGGVPLADVARRAVRNGCQVLAITGHADAGQAGASDAYFESLEQARRAHPQLVLLAGLEWNVPPWKGREHATLLVPFDVPERQVLREFQALFDDRERPMHNPDLAVQGLRWLELNHVGPSGPPVVIFNLPSRNSPKGDAGESLVAKLAQWREHSSLVAGFAGSPGRGDLDTIDRWDPAIAEIGGAWDQLLARGVPMWGAIATSGFQCGPLAPSEDVSAEDDVAVPLVEREDLELSPGEFSETWLYAPAATAEGALAALRAGTFFAAHGHIARQVQLQAFVQGLPRPAIAGEAIEAPAGCNLELMLHLEVPLRDWQGERNRIDEVELIGVPSASAGSLSSGPASAAAHVIARQVVTGGAIHVPLRVPAGGITVRACGRRIVAKGPDLAFYTNPIQIVTIGHPDERLVAADGAIATGGDPARRLPAWVVLLFVMAGSVVASLGDRWRIEVFRRFFPKRTLPQPAEYAIPHAWRRYFLVLLLGCIFLAVYGSLVPLEASDMDWSTAVSKFRALLGEPLVLGSRSDWLVNVLLFVPIGFLATGLVFGASPGDWRRGLGLVFVVVACGGLSLAIEFSQLFVKERVSSQNDVVAETLGSLIGASAWLVLGPPLIAWLGRLLDATRPRERLEHLLEAYAALVLLYMVLPLDLTVRPAELYDKWQEGKINLVPFQDIAAEALVGQLGDLVLLVPFGALAAIWRWPHGDRVRPLATSLAMGLLALTAIETAQLLVYSRFSSTTDLFAGLAAVAIGWCLTCWLVAASAGALTDPAIRRRARWVPILVVIHALLVAAAICLPFDRWASPAEAQERLHDLFSRPPLAAITQGPELHALSEILRKSLLFATLGGLLALAVQMHSGRLAARQLSVLAWLLGTALAAAIELLQVWLLGHGSDATDVLFLSLALAIGLIATHRVFGHSTVVSAR